MTDVVIACIIAAFATGWLANEAFAMWRRSRARGGTLDMTLAMRARDRARASRREW